MSLTTQLRPAQAEILTYRGGPLAISAVPGAGKTFVLTQLIARLVGDPELNVRPQQILVLTYMRGAATGFKRRAAQVLGSIEGAATVRAYRLGPEHVDLVRERSEVVFDLNMQATVIRERFYGRLNLAEVIGLGAVLAVGFWLVRDGAASVGQATAAALLFHRLFDPINTLLGLFDEGQAAAAGLARLVGVAEQYLRKGSKVYLEGKLQTRKWQDQSGNDRYSTEVVLQGPGAVMTMLDGAPGGGGGQRGGGGGDWNRGSGGGSQGGQSGGWNQGGSGQGGGSNYDDLDDDIPF